MKDTDTSDEAATRYFISVMSITGRGPGGQALAMWQECRSRCEARYNEAIECWSESIDSLKAQMEERERKAFEAGWDASDPDLRPREEFLEKAYRAFKEGQKE